MSNLFEEDPDCLHFTAYHEAGHKAILNRFGCHGEARVWSNLSGNPDEQLWGGQCRFICPTVQVVIAKDLRRSAVKLKLPKSLIPPLVKLPNNWSMLLGVAGMIAEEILDGIDDQYWVADPIHERIDIGDVSDTDLKAMNIYDIGHYDIASTSRAAKRAFGYLRKDWQFVRNEAEHLIKQALEETSLTRPKLIT